MRYNLIGTISISTLIIVFRLNNAGAQNPTQPAPGSDSNFFRKDSVFSFRSQKGYFPSLLHDFGEQAEAPLHFTASQWVYTGAAAVITAGLITIDNDIDNWATIQKEQHLWVRKSSPVITQFGSNAGLLSVAGFGLASAALKNEKGVQTSLLASQAVITSGVWVQMIKRFAPRERPFSAYKNSHQEGGHWYKPLAEFDQDCSPRKLPSSFDSFPSGHTATAFSIATVFAMQYKDKPAIPIISYSAATLVGISRLTEHEHWGSDVFVGALIGYLCGRQVVNHYNNTHKDVHGYNTNRSGIRPVYTVFQTGNQIGLSIIW